MSFRSKIFLVLALVGLAPLLVLGWLSFSLNRAELEKTVGGSQAAMAEEAARGAERTLARAIESLRLSVAILPVFELSQDERSAALLIPYRQLEFVGAVALIGRDGSLFGKVDAAAATSNPDGIGTGADHVGANLAIDQFPTDLIVNRGVLLDVARFVQGDARPLDATKEITADLLERTARHQGVTLKKGDTVFIRTGYGPLFKSNPKVYADPNASPGPSVGGAKFLIDHGARVVGDDTLTFEMRPPVVTSPKFQVFPVHMLLIADSGIYIIENLNLEELAEAKAYEFVVVVPPLKVLGGTGSALRAFALVPRDD